jgi:hypothetical protein
MESALATDSTCDRERVAESVNHHRWGNGRSTERETKQEALKQASVDRGGRLTLKRNGRSPPQRAATAGPSASGFRESQSLRSGPPASRSVEGPDGCVPIQSSA